MIPKYPKTKTFARNFFMYRGVIAYTVMMDISLDSGPYPCGYIVLHEDTVAPSHTFERMWELSQLSRDHWIYALSWHGGITYVKKNIHMYQPRKLGECLFEVPLRSITYGCDYAHYMDSGYTEHDAMCDLRYVIDELLEKCVIKLRCPFVGDYFYPWEGVQVGKSLVSPRGAKWHLNQSKETSDE